MEPECAPFHMLYGRERFLFMDRFIVIFVTDMRQKYLGEFLHGKKTEIHWTDEESEAGCLDALQKCTHLILPTPASKVSGTKDISELLKYHLINCQAVYGGKISPEWRAWFASRQIACTDLMEDEQVAQENALVTAEAVAAEILKVSGYSIRTQKVIVTGYGRCGRAVANLLQAMGANVTVLARSQAARKAAKADGHNASDFAYAADEAYGTYTVVNTVPDVVVTETMIRELPKEAVIIDIASAPGGVDRSMAEAYKIPVIHALGLPSRYTTRTSAKILADAIQRQMLPHTDLSEDRSWIFQILM